MRLTFYMKSKLKLSLSIFFCFIFSNFELCYSTEINTQTQNNKENYKNLSLVDILNIALSNNPKVKEYWLNIDSSKHSYYGELSEYLPNLSASISYSNSKSKLKNVKNSSSTKNETLNPSLNMSYLLFNFGGRTADVMNFKYKLNAVKYNTNKYIQDFIYKVIEAYYNLFSSIANEIVSQELENSSLEVYNSASLKYKIGLVSLTDKLQAETSYNQMRLKREKAENQVKINKANLNYLLNINPSIDLELEIPILDIDKDEFEINVIDLFETAINNRPDLKSYYETKKAKKAELYSSIVDWLPSLSLNASYSEPQNFKNRHNTHQQNYNIGLTATMNFFTGGRIYNNIAKSKTELNIVKEQIRDLEKEIELDVWTAYQNFKTAKNTYITSQILVESATENANTMLGKYKNGKTSMLNLLDAQANLYSAKYELISSQYNWFISRANLLKALGKMTPEETINLLDSYKYKNDNIENNETLNNNSNIENNNDISNENKIINEDNKNINNENEVINENN